MTQDQLLKLIKTLGDEYEAGLIPLPGSKKTKGDLTAGFRDGLASMAAALRQNGHLTVRG